MDKKIQMSLVRLACYVADEVIGFDLVAGGAFDLVFKQR